MHKAVRRIVCAALAMGLLAGCGLKGDLVLPEDATPTAAETPAAAPAAPPRVDAPSADEPADEPDGGR